MTEGAPLLALAPATADALSRWLATEAATRVAKGSTVNR